MTPEKLSMENENLNRETARLDNIFNTILDWYQEDKGVIKNPRVVERAKHLFFETMNSPEQGAKIIQPEDLDRHKKIVYEVMEQAKKELAIENPANTMPVGRELNEEKPHENREPLL